MCPWPSCVAAAAGRRSCSGCPSPCCCSRWRCRPASWPGGPRRRRSAGSCCARAPRSCCPLQAWAAGRPGHGGRPAGRRARRPPDPAAARRGGDGADLRPVSYTAGRGWDQQTRSWRPRPSLACWSWRSAGRSGRPGTAPWACSSPGLLGLAIAVIASRLLPLACRSAFARTSTGGGIGLFLALRHVARRPGGTRTTIVLATAFALSRVRGHRLGRGPQQRAPRRRGRGRRTGRSHGRCPGGQNLGTIVDHADPGGRMAAAVDRYTSACPAAAPG